MWSNCGLKSHSVFPLSESSHAVKDGNSLHLSADCTLCDVLHDDNVCFMKYIGLYDPVADVTA